MTIWTGQLRWRELREEVGAVEGLFGAPEGWSTRITWGAWPMRRRVNPGYVVGRVTAVHERGAVVVVSLLADGSRVYAGDLQGGLGDETLPAAIARLERQ